MCTGTQYLFLGAFSGLISIKILCVLLFVLNLHYRHATFSQNIEIEYLSLHQPTNTVKYTSMTKLKSLYN